MYSDLIPLHLSFVREFRCPSEKPVCQMPFQYFMKGTASPESNMASPRDEHQLCVSSLVLEEIRGDPGCLMKEASLVSRLGWKHGREDLSSHAWIGAGRVLRGLFSTHSIGSAFWAGCYKHLHPYRNTHPWLSVSCGSENPSLPKTSTAGNDLLS